MSETIRVYWIVLNAKGNPMRAYRRTRNVSSLYLTENAAKRAAQNEGDSVVRVYLNLDEEPVHIKHMVYKE